MTAFRWPKGSQPLDPEEWDFRGLGTEEFDAALSYEIAREHPDLNEALGLLTPRRRTELQRSSREDWNNENHEWLKSGELTYQQLYRLWNIFYACWCSDKFPAPWMTLSVAERKVAVKRFGQKEPVRVISREGYRRSEEFREMAEKASGRLGSESHNEDAIITLGQYIIEIDWSTDDAILKSALLKLLALRPERTRPRRRHTGKKAVPQGHLFRQLAAWRLGAKKALNYKSAWALIALRKKDFPRADPSKLLPEYDSPGGWKDAVDAGKNLVRRGL